MLPVLALRALGRRPLPFAVEVQAIRATGERGLRLPSGATHDTSAMADLCPVAMLFLACRGGISHNPAEYCAPQIMACAVRALAELLPRLPVSRG